MEKFEFPDFIRRLPQADIPFAGLAGWILQGESSQQIFLACDVEVQVAEHSHGEQWGFVIAGAMEFTIGGATRAYRRGDSYHIPAGVPHRAVLQPGFRAVDYFADRNRYLPRKSP